jgi:ribonuclease HII
MVDRIVADGKRLFSALRERHPHLEAVDKGESVHASVAAASVLAKSRRDELFELMCQRYARDFGPIGGGGYVNAATRRFLRAYARARGCLPPEARRSWPHDDLRDILGASWGPYGDLPGKSGPAQLDLFAGS